MGALSFDHAAAEKQQKQKQQQRSARSGDAAQSAQRARSAVSHSAATGHLPRQARHGSAGRCVYTIFEACRGLCLCEEGCLEGEKQHSCLHAQQRHHIIPARRSRACICSPSSPHTHIHPPLLATRIVVVEVAAIAIALLALEVAEALDVGHGFCLDQGSRVYVWQPDLLYDGVCSDGGSDPPDVGARPTGDGAYLKEVAQPRAQRIYLGAAGTSAQRIECRCARYLGAAGAADRARVLRLAPPFFSAAHSSYTGQRHLQESHSSYTRPVNLSALHTSPSRRPVINAAADS